MLNNIINKMKQNSNQKSILSFFNNTESSKKRTYSEMTNYMEGSKVSVKDIRRPSVEEKTVKGTNLDSEDKEERDIFLMTNKKIKIVDDDERFQTPGFKLTSKDESVPNSFDISNFGANSANNVPRAVDLVKKFRTSVTNQPEGNVSSNNKNTKSTKVNKKSIANEEVEENDELFHDTMAVNPFTNPENGLPDFLKSENIKDKNGRRPDDLNYDPTTLHVPPAFLKQQTPCMTQFWNFKQDHFDKVLLFKLGKFYELFFDDAIVGNQVLDLNWMGNDPKKLHVGFPEKIMEEKAYRLIEAGFKVAVVEQMETPEELQERTANLRGPEKDKCVKRELCNVYTKGTHIKVGASYQNKFCIALTSNYFTGGSSKNMSQSSGKSTSYVQWGFVIFDVTTLRFYVGQLKEDDEHDSFNKLMSLVYNIRPEEVIVMRNNIPQYVLTFLKTLSCRTQVTFLKNEYSTLNLNKLCSNYFNSSLEDWDPLVLNYVSNEESHKLACIALYITILYLEKILLAEQCLKIAKFEEYSGNALQLNQRLVMDYQAVTNLELIETKLDPKNPESGSLMDYMNRAVTQFGKRKFRNWLLNPLCNPQEINERLDMVEDFMTNYELLDIFRNSLAKWPDVERQASKIYKFAISSNSKAVYFEDISKIKLQEFFNLINFLKKSVELFTIFTPYIYEGKIKSERLLTMIQISDEVGYVPNIKQELEEFSLNFSLKDDNDGNVLIEPREGIMEEYDNTKVTISEIHDRLDDILNRYRKELKCAIINYVHTKHYKFEMEVPEEYVKGDKRPKAFILTTSKKGYLRFHTDEILKLVKRLDEEESHLKDELRKFNIILFKQFYSKSVIIQQYFDIIAELDCLSTLAVVSMASDGITCRPKFVDNNGTPVLKLINSRHPCLSSKSSYFVPNDVVIGENDKTSIVITGPNMGGKSTLLRQTCVCVIMAQIGCYVPAESFVLSPVDRIFTRIGAKDKILEGKSTFYIEMEETKNIIQNATINSLVIIDELGRGTSTKDGIIIAKTILDRLEKRIRCRTLFTTHYHSLLDWCSTQPGIELCFMDSVVGNDSKDITFLYKFRKGFCPQSYGIHVAKLAGLPEAIITLASEVAEWHRNKNHK